jgi:hypothetical protein
MQCGLALQMVETVQAPEAVNGPKASRPQGVAQPGSAPVLGTGGHRFESCHPDNCKVRHVYR